MIWLLSTSLLSFSFISSLLSVPQVVYTVLPEKRYYFPPLVLCPRYALRLDILLMFLYLTNSSVKTQLMYHLPQEPSLTPWRPKIPVRLVIFAALVEWN